MLLQLKALQYLNDDNYISCITEPIYNGISYLPALQDVASLLQQCCNVITRQADPLDCDVLPLEL